MKKFIINNFDIILVLISWIICFCLAASCNDTVLDSKNTPEEIFQVETILYDVTFEGNTHQMLWYKAYVGNGVYDVEMTHWPDCKYCK